MARADAPAHIIKNDRSLIMCGIFRVRTGQYEELLVARFSRIVLVDFVAAGIIVRGGWGGYKKSDGQFS